ncbi:hypothetical protein HY745_06050 [Candidatus Desantisbacteria bacterium]|nr:hypothetical protein [Candidatus Desantisbacteria bacterium]
MTQIFGKDTEEYSGKYIALKDFDDETIVTSGNTILETYDNAIKKGYADPVVIYIPPKNMVQIY